MKTTRHRIYTVGFALALATSSLHATTSTLPAPKPEFLNSEQLAEWRAKKTAAFEAKQAQESAATSQAEHFYTGKPYIEETGQYAFLFRSYDRELNRWTTTDPSGFPDGANNWSYVMNSPLNAVDIKGLQTGLITGLDITPRVLRSGSWVDITGGGNVYISKDTRFELLITNDPNDFQLMLDASRKPLGGYAVSKNPNGSIYPTLANQSIGGFDSLPIVSGAHYWGKRFWVDGITYPLVKLDGSISDMLEGGVWDALVLYNPNSDPEPMSWTISGSILE